MSNYQFLFILTLTDHGSIFKDAIKEFVDMFYRRITLKDQEDTHCYHQKLGNLLSLRSQSFRTHLEPNKKKYIPTYRT